jgi:hypothetical protein
MRPRGPRRRRRPPTRKPTTPSARRATASARNGPSWSASGGRASPRRGRGSRRRRPAGGATWCGPSSTRASPSRCGSRSSWRPRSTARRRRRSPTSGRSSAAPVSPPAGRGSDRAHGVVSARTFCADRGLPTTPEDVTALRWIRWSRHLSTDDSARRPRRPLGHQTAASRLGRTYRRRPEEAVPGNRRARRERKCVRSVSGSRCTGPRRSPRGSASQRRRARASSAP